MRRGEGGVGDGEAKVSSTQFIEGWNCFRSIGWISCEYRARHQKRLLESSESGGWMIDSPQRIGREAYNGIK